MGISATQLKSMPIKFPAGGTLKYNTAEKSRALLNNFGKNGGGGPKIGFRGMKANFGKTGVGQRNLEERHARLAKADGVSLKGDFEQRWTGRGKTENKPACFEC